MSFLWRRTSFSQLKRLLVLGSVLIPPLFFLFRGSVLEQYTLFGFDTVIQVSLPRRYSFLRKDLEGMVLHFDRLWNRFSPESTVWKINRFASWEVDADTLSVLEETLQLSEATGGSFCPLIAPLLDLWGFSTEPRVPEKEKIEQIVRDISQSRLVIEGNRVSIQGKGQLDLGGVAKGYLLDAMVAFLKRRGVRKFLINAGGQVYGFGSQWKVGVFDPVVNTVRGYIIINDMSVSTSGDYFRFFEQDGIRYHHVLNPRTGYPGRDFRSVTVVASRALLADVLSTAILAGGREALSWVEKNFPEVALLTIDAAGVWSFSKNMSEIFVFLPLHGVQP